MRVLISRLKGLFGSHRQDQELNEELQAHLEMLVEENRRKGMPAEEARRVAGITLGGIAQTEAAYREARGVHFVQTFLQDLRYALRMLRRSPGFSAVVVISLALGIGANTAIFSAIDAVMLRMLPVEDPRQLVMLHWHAPRHPQKYVGDLEGSGFGNAKEGYTSYSFAYEQYQQFKNENHVFSSTFAFAANNDSVNIGIDGRAETTVMQGVSGNYFEGLGVKTILGRPITFEDDQESAPATAVVSYEFWRGRLGASQDIVGKKIVVNALPVTILGVAPPEFFGLEPGGAPGLYVPLAMYSTQQSRQGGTDSGLTYLNDPKVWWAGVVGRPQTRGYRGSGRSRIEGDFRSGIECRGTGSGRQQADIADQAGQSRSGRIAPPIFQFALLVDDDGRCGPVDCLRQRGRAAADTRQRKAKGNRGAAEFRCSTIEAGSSIADGKRLTGMLRRDSRACDREMDWQGITDSAFRWSSYQPGTTS
jgi:hypothetical protein